MKINGVELRRISLPLVHPFRTSFGTQTERDILLIKVVTPDSEGWGECVAGAEPFYSSEYTEAAQHVIKSHLLPRLFASSHIDSSAVEQILRAVKGHPMAKAALEMAILDAELSQRGESFAEPLGAVCETVPAGVSVGIMDSIPQLLAAVSGYLAEGYVRIKLKIEPGWDIEPVRAVRTEFGDDLMLQVDANTAYSVADASHLAKLDEFDLLLIEQPLAEDDVRGHADLAKIVKTPICLDESIISARSAADAIALGACQIINIKPGRVGGYLQARAIHDVCAAHGVPVWCGGMLETGLGRAANLALAALPNFTLPGDVSASGRYYARDITEAFVLEQGHIKVPQGPGLGVRPIPDILDEITTSTEYIAAA
ncbi:MAG: o-succinylbenzoate synthase [Actinobacteria bacterium]|nr:o-succinylbenzoate synthase [Actinomycetota bacterium]